MATAAATTRAKQSNYNDICPCLPLCLASSASFIANRSNVTQGTVVVVVLFAWLKAKQVAGPSLLTGPSKRDIRETYKR